MDPAHHRWCFTRQQAQTGRGAPGGGHKSEFLGTSSVGVEAGAWPSCGGKRGGGAARHWECEEGVWTSHPGKEQRLQGAQWVMCLAERFLMAVVIKNRLCQTPLIASLNAIADGGDKRAEGRAALCLSSGTKAHSLRNWTLPRQMEMMLLVHPCSPNPAGLWHLRTRGSGAWGRAPWSHSLTGGRCILCYLQGTGRPRQL